MNCNGAPDLELITVPLIVRWPDTERGDVDRNVKMRNVPNLIIIPTIADLQSYGFGRSTIPLRSMCCNNNGELGEETF